MQRDCAAAVEALQLLLLQGCRFCFDDLSCCSHEELLLLGQHSQRMSVVVLLQQQQHLYSCVE
jgi:hypothetical protein